MGLVQIQKAIPPWHQSTELITSCPRFYVEAVIKGQPQPGGMDSARGRQIHQTGAAYAAHCALKGISMDLKAFDDFAAGAGPVAARILTGMRESYQIDHEHFMAAELTMSLDEQFRPTGVPEVIAEGCTSSGEPPMAVGTLDALYMFAAISEARIDDLKSHPRPFDPAETSQAKAYALMVFLHFPWVTKLIFRLIFVRYKNLTREVEYQRSDIPMLIAAVKASRDRQVKIHVDYEAGREIEALAGSHCIYCPLLANAKCPIAQFNPNMQVTPEKRLNYMLWYGQFARANSKTLKEYVQETGRPVVLKDFNGKAYSYGPVEKESEVYPVFKFTSEGMQVIEGHRPVLPIIDLLYDYAHDNPDDSQWMSKLTLSGSGLKKYLKTNKRSFLDQAVEDSCDKVTKASLRVSKPLDVAPDEDEWDDDYDEEGDE